MIGASGLVGRSLAPLLVASGHDVLILARRPAGMAETEEIVGEMDAWPALLGDRGIDVAISTLGTTWRNAGSWAAFEAVDRGAVVAFARAARAAGAGQMVTVSSTGADPGSQSRYLAIKGHAERDLALLGYERLDVLRPGLLRGERGTDRRRGERIAIRLSPLTNLMLRGPLDRFAAIDAEAVARATAALVGQRDPGQFVHHNREIRRLARRAG